ncbi:MAG: Uma2 family endonuclease [Myxococcota bacterium]
MSTPTPTDLGARRVRPLRRREFDRLVELGMFGDEPIELLGGELVYMSPQGSRHAWCVARLSRLLVTRLEADEVRIQLPLALSDVDEPEPDVAVVPAGDYRDEHPRVALLVIEVSASSLRDDVGRKVPMYASAGVPDLWVVDVDGGRVLVHRDPRDGRYLAVEVFERGASVALLARPQVVIATDDILP